MSRINELNEGLRCEIHFEKMRSLLGEAAKPSELRMEPGPDKCVVWTTRGLEDTEEQRAAALLAEGCFVRSVAEGLDISMAASEWFGSVAGEDEI